MTDFTGGRGFFQYMTMSGRKIFSLVVLHLILALAVYRLLSGGTDAEEYGAAGIYVAWGIVIVVFGTFWIGSYLDYRRKKKGISR